MTKDDPEPVARDDSAARPPATPGAPTDRNPYLVVLTALILVFVAVAFILYLTAAGQSDSGNRGALATVGAANEWLFFAGITFLAAMIVGGITWHSTHRGK